MIPPPIPSDEAKRLAALRGYGIPDSLPESEYDDITRLAARICDVPVVAISLVDGDRQWFKSSIGLDMSEISRDVSFCAHAMLGQGVMLVPDAARDPRFADNPLVLGGPRIRFYAGTPLVTSDRQPLGALCVIDIVPRELSPVQFEALEALGRQVMAQLELRRTLAEQTALNRRLADSESESRRLSLIARQSAHAIVITGLDGRILWANQAFAGMTGYDEAEYLGRKPGSLLQGPDSDPAVVAMMREHLRFGKNIHCEIINYRKNGAPYWLQLEIQPFCDETGDQIGFMSIQLDVTRRKLAECAVRESEARFRGLAASSPIGIFQTDPVGCCVYTNERWREIYGLNAEQSLGAGWVQSLHPEDCAGVFESWRAASRHGREYEHRFRLLRADGSGRHVHLRARPVTDDAGKVTGYVGSVADITAAKEAEAALQAACDAALAASRAKGDFLAMISHEIRTPMNGILGFAQMLQGTPLTPQQTRFAGIIRDSGEDLLTIINDVLDTSKIEAGHVELEQRAFDLRVVVENVLELLSPRARERHLALTLDCPDDLDTHVVGDRVRVRQIILNLAGNALKFTETGEVRILLSRLPDGSLRLAVRDTGDGIPTEKQAALFEKFSQVDSSPSRRHGGTGLVLAICRQIVGLMGGSIGLLSPPGGGAEFWFTLPPRPESSPITSPALPAAPAAEPRAGLHILLAEDNPTNQILARLILEALGCSVTVASDGESALECYRDARPDLVLMDCQMPRLDGYEATRALRALERDGHRTPVIALTANATTGDREKCEAAGMDGFVCKPVHAEELRAVLARWFPA
jgi:PAS domain S-box-containing protein